MKRGVHWLAMVVGLALDFIGLFGVPDDLATAYALLGHVQPIIDSWPFRIGALAVGTLLLAWSFGIRIGNWRFQKLVNSPQVFEIPTETIKPADLCEVKYSLKAAGVSATVLAFDDSVVESATWVYTFPLQFDGCRFRYRLQWSHGPLSRTYHVVFSVRGPSHLDRHSETTIEFSDDGGTGDHLYWTEWSPKTPTINFRGDSTFAFQLSRLAVSDRDTLIGDAFVSRLQIECSHD